MSTEQQAIDAIPSNVDINNISDTLSDPTQFFRMLDKDHGGYITKEDLQLLLQEFSIDSTAANILSRYIFQELDTRNQGTIDSSILANAGNILWNLLQKKQKSGGY